MTKVAKALQPRLAVAKLQHAKPPKRVYAVCQFSWLSLFHLLDCTQLALGASEPNTQGGEQQGHADFKRTHSRVGLRASQLHSKIGRVIEYVGTKVMGPQDHGHHHGPMTLLGSAQFARRFKGSTESGNETQLERAQRMRKGNRCHAMWRLGFPDPEGRESATPFPCWLLVHSYLNRRRPDIVMYPFWEQVYNKTVFFETWR